mmetsp:Transcript_39245/g.62871  ORF Transcript_39245/g.62871 Transcript_39245/m.62871 type:complete len:91 (-) Transcript_39245:91-363(-)
MFGVRKTLSSTTNGAGNCWIILARRQSISSIQEATSFRAGENFAVICCGSSPRSHPNLRRKMLQLLYSPFYSFFLNVFATHTHSEDCVFF